MIIDPRTDRIFGRGGSLRQLRPSDRSRFEAHLLRLDPESRRDRFNGPAKDDFVAAYAARCFDDGTTVVGYLEGEQVFGAAELHEVDGEARPTAEIAFSVERELRNCGLGSVLFRRLVLHAHAFGYRALNVTTHPDNDAMKRLARRFGAGLRFSAGETMGVIELPEIGGFELLPAVAGPASDADPQRFTLPG